MVMQTTSISQKTQFSTPPAIPASTPTAQDTAEEFSEIIIELSQKNKRSVKRTEAADALAGLFAFQPTTASIARSTSEQINKKEEKSLEKEAATESDSQDSTKARVESAPQVREDQKTQGNKERSSGLDKQEKKFSDNDRPRDNHSKTEVKDTAAREKFAHISATNSGDLAFDPSTKAVVTSQKTSTDSNLVNTNTTGEELPAAEIAVRNLMQQLGVELKGLAKESAPVATPVIAGMVAEITRNAINEIRAPKFSQMTGIESAQRMEAPAQKTREGQERSDIARQGKNQAPVKKDFQVAVQRIEDALKEAITAKDGKSVSLRLDPPNLGTVKVEVTLKEGNLYARVVVDNSQMGALLREKGGELQESLRKLGLDVDKVNVFISNGNGQEQEFRDHLPQQAKNNNSLKLMINDDSGIDAKSLVPGLIGGKGFEQGWVA